MKTKYPTESQEQIALFRYAAIRGKQDERWNLMFHIGNERKCSWITGKRLKAEGVRPGIPDIFLPVPNGDFHGMFIEMKSIKGSLSIIQGIWMDALVKQGYWVVVCHGAERAIQEIEDYLK
jgi:hypothetical protein